MCEIKIKIGIEVVEKIIEMFGGYKESQFLLDIFKCFQIVMSDLEELYFVLKDFCFDVKE